MPREPPVTSTTRPSVPPSARGMLTACSPPTRLWPAPGPEGVSAAQRTTALAHDMPAPNPDIRTRSPGPRRPASAASASARGTEALEVLPVRSTTTATRSMGMPEPVGGRFDDAQVGLMGDEQRDVARAQLGPVEGVGGGVDRDAHGSAEHLFALHDHVAAVGAGEKVVRAAVDPEVDGEQAVVVARPRARPRRRRRRRAPPWPGRRGR